MSASKVATLSAKDNFLKRYWTLLTGKAKAEAEGTLQRRTAHRADYKKKKKLSKRQEKKYANYREHHKPKLEAAQVGSQQARNNRAEWLDHRIGKAKEHFKTVGDSTSKTRRNTALAGAGVVGATAAGVAIGSRGKKKKPKTSTKYTRYSEIMDDALMEFGIGRSMRKISSELKSGKRTDLAQTPRDIHEAKKHTVRRIKHLTSGRATDVSKKKGGLAMAGIRADSTVARYFRTLSPKAQAQALKLINKNLGVQRVHNKGAGLSGPFASFPDQ
jgi:hypothetical protein